MSHILLTSLGTRVFENTKYEWQGQEVSADLAPLALMELFKELGLSTPDRFVAVVTEGAQTTTWPVFQKGVRSHFGVEPKKIRIPDGRSSNEIRKILESVANPEYIPEGAELTLDVTQGFRHFPFIFYALVLYLKSLRRVNIRGAYYGMVDGMQQDEPKPIIDLQPLLELPEWFHAVRMFRNQGTTKSMADLLQPLTNQLQQEGNKLRKKAMEPPPEAIERYKQANQVKSSIDWLEKYAFAYESALPLELEKASRGLKDSIQKLPTIDSSNLPPLVGELTESITSAAEKSAFKASPGGGKWKGQIRLDEDELKRQAYMIDLYLKRNQLSLAVGLMREWTISWIIWKSGNCEEIERWLDLDVRERYSNELGTIGAAARGIASAPTCISCVPKGFGDFWNRLTGELRNALHHHGMRVDAVEEPLKSLEKVKQFWNDLKLI